MGPDRLTPELLQRCHEAFTIWDVNLFSFPVNLPGFGEFAIHPQHVLYETRECQGFPFATPAFGCHGTSMQGEPLRRSLKCLTTLSILLAALAGRLHWEPFCEMCMNGLGSDLSPSCLHHRVS